MRKRRFSKAKRWFRRVRREAVFLPPSPRGGGGRGGPAARLNADKEKRISPRGANNILDSSPLYGRPTMAVVTPKALVGKLNPTCLRSFQGAAGLCLSRTNYNVEIEHWLVKLLEVANTDLTRILRHYDVDTTRVNRELTRALDQLKTGNARAPELSL